MQIPPGSETRSLEVIAEPVGRLACLSDIHGNTPALDAVLGSDEFATADAVAVLGCATAGPDPLGVLQRLGELALPTHYLSGNGERAILEMAGGSRPLEHELDEWLVAAHGPAEIATLSGWPSMLSCTLRAGTRVRLCHGSPRSDIELFTPETPPERVNDACAEVDEPILVHGHTHIQYSRHVSGRQIIGPGSIGLPYTDGAGGAHWALLSDTVELVVTAYDIGAVERLVVAAGYPSSRFLEQLHSPPAPAELIADAERWVFRD